MTEAVGDIGVRGPACHRTAVRFVSESGGEKSMKARIDLMRVNPGIMHAMLGLEQQVHQARLDPTLLDLVRMRASQINGCAYCLDMHSKDARANGETEQRLY